MFNQKCRQVRYIFKWCKNYKELHNIRWEDHLNQYGEIQARLPQRNDGNLDAEVKKANLDKLEIKLKFWQQRAKSKWRAWEDSNTKWFF